MNNGSTDAAAVLFGAVTGQKWERVPSKRQHSLKAAVRGAVAELKAGRVGPKTRALRRRKPDDFVVRNRIVEARLAADCGDYERAVEVLETL